MKKHNLKTGTVFHIPLILQEEPEGGFTVIAPSLPGCITYGKNLAEAKRMAQDAIKLYLEDVIADGEEIPQFESAYLSEVEVTVPHNVAAAHA